MPGGQYTNLKAQAKALGIGDDKWHLLAKLYAEVNQLFGDIVKVTPSSKVVGDMAIMMLNASLSTQDILDPKVSVSFPESVVSMIKGELGQPAKPFAQQLQDRVLKGQATINKRPGAIIARLDLDQVRSKAQAITGKKLCDNELASYIIYEEVFKNFALKQKKYADVSIIPTYNFFYGMQRGEEIELEIDKGNSFVLKYLTVGEMNSEGIKEVFFEVNGRPQVVRIKDNNANLSEQINVRAEEGNAKHIAAPMPAAVAKVTVVAGQRVKKDEMLVNLEAMKMQTAITAHTDGIIDKVLIQVGDNVLAGDLLISLK